MFIVYVGSLEYLEWGSVYGIHLKAGTWAVEYARGFVPSTLFTAIADSMFCTLDYVSLYYTARLIIKTMVLEAGYYMTHVQELFA